MLFISHKTLFWFWDDFCNSYSKRKSKIEQLWRDEKAFVNYQLQFLEWLKKLFDLMHHIQSGVESLQEENFWTHLETWKRTDN